ncbi:hypothetical protein GCM10020367_36340 [Streptomyces sannanensis]|uniref:Uncharacterized protein n=1 Tax=Streptomyces sannanensis TaxID=285536 RepID=A0ABP6SEB0_9ACTN
MTDHLGGPESEEKLLARHRRYVASSARPAAEGRMFRPVTNTLEELAGHLLVPSPPGLGSTRTASVPGKPWLTRPAQWHPDLRERTGDLPQLRL